MPSLGSGKIGESYIITSCFNSIFGNARFEEVVASQSREALGEFQFGADNLFHGHRERIRDDSPQHLAR
jgi:hypothetical protein